jgi:hypothetical protein
MSRDERIAARCAVAVTAVCALTYHWASAAWAFGLITGWLLSSGVNRGRR